MSKDGHEAQCALLDALVIFNINKHYVGNTIELIINCDLFTRAECTK